MGIIVFLVATIASVYGLNKFYRSLANDLPPPSSRRRVMITDNLRSVDRAIPVVKPVTETQIPVKPAPKVPERVLPIVPPAPIKLDRQPERLPNFTIAPSPTEESLLFRSLVHGMFCISIIATDLAAGTHYSWAGIPFATVGAAWSWYRRHAAKHWLNIAVSGGSLVILMGVIGPILAKQMQVGIENYGIPAVPATKISVAIALALGMLCAALQMGLSFHLYSRRVLGYCFVISGLLMGVAASLSQNLGFLILLCAFVAISIPALMLDYRSKLALKPIGISSFPTRSQLSYQHLPWKYLGQLAAISLGLGLMLAVFLPNFQLPNLSFQPPGLDRFATIAQKYHLPKPDPQSPSPQPLSTPKPEPTIRELATTALGQPDNNNYPDIIKQENLQLPPELASKLQQFTQKILATSPQPLKSDFERATYIAEYLKQHQKVDPQQQLAANKQVAADAKLFEQFITKCAAAPKSCQLAGNKQDRPIFYLSMLRSIGIPARLKMGDKLGEIDPQTKLYSQLPEQAQSHTEVYFPNWGWLDLDSTPDRPLFNLDLRQLEQLKQIAFSAQPIQLSTSPQPSATPTSSSSSPNQNNPSPTPQTPPSSSTPSPKHSIPLNSPLPTPSAARSPWVADPVILRIIVAAIAICSAISWYLWYQHQQQQQLAKLPPVEQIYRSMVANLSKQGLVKRPAQTQLEYAESASKIYPPQIAKVVWEISHLYTTWRYGKQKIDVKQLAKKLQYLQHLQHLAAKKQRK